jgi:hypothetical protein
MNFPLPPSLFPLPSSLFPLPSSLLLSEYEHFLTKKVIYGTNFKLRLRKGKKGLYLNGFKIATSLTHPKKDGVSG